MYALYHKRDDPKDAVDVTAQLTAMMREPRRVKFNDGFNSVFADPFPGHYLIIFLYCKIALMNCGKIIMMVD